MTDAPRHKRPAQSIWARFARALAAPPPYVSTCVADDCERPSVPPDGPFCEQHDWSTARRVVDAS